MMMMMIIIIIINVYLSLHLTAMRTETTSERRKWEVSINKNTFDVENKIRNKS